MLPETEVEILFDQYKDELEYQYNNYYLNYYSSIEKFAAAYFGLSQGQNYLDYMRSRAEAVLTEKLVFYYVIRAEGLVPDDDEFSKLYNTAVDEQTEYFIERYYKDEVAKLQGEAKEKRIAEIRAEVIRYYGEEYFKESVYYNYAVDTLVSYVIVE